MCIRDRVDGQLSIVMGREEKDKTRTVKIVPIQSDSIELRLRVTPSTIRGDFRVPDENDWRYVGECEPLSPPNLQPRITLQFYQGPADAEHWAQVHEFSVKALSL